MLSITFNAFSFLRRKIKEKRIKSYNTVITVNDNTSAEDLIKQVNLRNEDVEVVFINGKVAPFNTILRDGDRVALIPPGTPGPYRVLLGFKNKKIADRNKNHM